MSKSGTASKHASRQDRASGSKPQGLMLQPHASEIVPGPGRLPQPYASPPAAYWAPDAIYLANLQEMILNQVHYYFSTENLLHDEFLRGHMNPEGGWIAISLLASFNRLRQLTTDIALIAETLKLSPELEVAHGAVRKRHGWQQWVMRKASSPLHASTGAGGDAGATEASDDAADTAVETGSAPRSPTDQRPAADAASGTTMWRDAASKSPPPPPAQSSTQRSSIPAAASALPASGSPPTSPTHSGVGVLPAASATMPSAAASVAAAAATAPAVGLPPTMPQATAPTAAPPSHRPKPVSQIAAVRREDAGWETPSLKGKDRRSRSKGGLSTEAGVSVTHLASADSSLCSGKVQLIDEQRSDETTLMAEDDWASSGTEEAILLSTSPVSASLPSAAAAAPPAALPSWPSAATKASGAVGGGARAPLGSSGARKRSSGGVVRKGAEQAKGGDKGRGRGGIKELNDAPPIRRQSPGLLAALDWELISSYASHAANATKRLGARCIVALSVRTPQTQALVRAHAHEGWLQACLATVVLLLLSLAQLCPLPPSLGQLASCRWVELPIALFVAVKFNEVSATILSGCTPAAVRHA